MKFVAVLVLALVCTYAVESDVFAELKETEFGSTLVDTIQIQLATSDNVDHVVSMIREVRSDLRARQGEIKAAHDEVADSCRADLDALTRKIDHSENVAVKNQRLYDIDHPVFVSRTEEKANKEAELADRVETAGAMQDQEDFAQAAHEAVVEEHRQVQQMMHTARAIMEEGFGNYAEGEFLQVKTSAYSKLSSHIRAFVPLKEQGISHGYAQIFNVLASIAERAPTAGDHGMVDTIMRIFDDIEENLENSLAIERTANEQRQDAYAELEGRIDREIDSLEAKIADLGRVILQLTFACASYNSNVEAATQAMADDQQLADDRSAGCQLEDNQYQADNARVSSQITVAGNAIYLMDNKRELLERFRA